MIRPSEDVMRAINSLNGDHNWEKIVEWIEESLHQQSISNNHKTGEDTIKGQGRCLELEEMIKHISEVHKYLINIRENDKIKTGGSL